MTLALLIAGAFVAAAAIAAVIHHLDHPDRTDASELDRPPSAHLELAERSA